MTDERWAAVEQYIVKNLLPDDPVLADALRDSTAAGLPAIQVAQPEGEFLYILASMLRAERVLEIGTLGGYSTIYLGRAVAPRGTVITIEVSSTNADVARRNIDRAGLSSVVDVRVGRALDVLPTLAADKRAPFDLVFIDADKENNATYFDWALTLSRPGSLIIVDNVVRDGAVLDAESKDASVQGVRRFYERVAAETRVRATAIQTVGTKGYDGMAFMLVTG
jgi:predicted O-methyltransferase YrrM